MFKLYCFMFSAHTLNCNYWFNYLFVVTSRAHFTHCVHCGHTDLWRGEKGQGLQVDTHLTLVCPWSQQNLCVVFDNYWVLISFNETKAVVEEILSADSNSSGSSSKGKPAFTSFMHWEKEGGKDENRKTEKRTKAPLKGKLQRYEWVKERKESGVKPNLTITNTNNNEFTVFVVH